MKIKKLVLYASFGVLTAGSASLLTPTASAQKQIAPALKFGDPLPANAFVELAKMINPAVVNISTSSNPRQLRGGNRDPLLDMLQEFYGYRGAPPTARPMQALGTGFVIRQDGLIVTNTHVISGADKIQVQFAGNDKMYDATLVGSDARTDIALIKIKNGEKHPVAQLGSSKDLEVGEWVAAFGNPFGQGHTMTKGIISAKGREIGEINRFPLIQTDTPINPGNSGGPLVNMRGQVIGVNSAIDARAQGIGFAIPIDDVKAIIPILEKEGRIKAGYLGVGLADINPQAAMYLGMKDTNGALITSVDPKGPASKSGIRPYDVITELNGKKIETVTDLMNAVADTAVNSKAKIKLFREGKTKTVEATIADRPDQPRARGSLGSRERSGQKAPHEIGFQMADSNDQLRQEFEIPPQLGKHPVVVSVDAGGRADEAGLAPGDVILEVNRKPVASTQEVMKQLKKGTNTLRISRGDTIAIIMF